VLFFVAAILSSSEISNSRKFKVPCGRFLASKEAWKKRTFFPEDVVNSNFHLCLLFFFAVIARVRSTRSNLLQSWRLLRSFQSLAMTNDIKQKILHPLRDEGRIALRGTTQIRHLVLSFHSLVVTWSRDQTTRRL